ncbi:MAG: hypothetical protein ABSC87_07630 [Halobacteriota archaeon]
MFKSDLTFSGAPDYSLQVAQQSWVEELCLVTYDVDPEEPLPSDEDDKGYCGNFYDWSTGTWRMWDEYNRDKSLQQSAMHIDCAEVDEPILELAGYKNDYADMAAEKLLRRCSTSWDAYYTCKTVCTMRGFRIMHGNRSDELSKR